MDESEDLVSETLENYVPKDVSNMIMNTTRFIDRSYCMAIFDPPVKCVASSSRYFCTSDTTHHVMIYKIPQDIDDVKFNSYGIDPVTKVSQEKYTLLNYTISENFIALVYKIDSLRLILAVYDFVANVRVFKDNMLPDTFYTCKESKFTTGSDETTYYNVNRTGINKLSFINKDMLAIYSNRGIALYDIKNKSKRIILIRDISENLTMPLPLYFNGEIAAYTNIGENFGANFEDKHDLYVFNICTGVLKIFTYLCDIFTMSRIRVLKNGKVIIAHSSENKIKKINDITYINTPNCSRSTDDSLLSINGTGNVYRVLDTGIKLIYRTKRAIKFASFSNDRRLMAVYYADDPNSIFITDLKNKKTVCRIKIDSHTPQLLSFMNNDEKLLIVSSSNGKYAAMIFDLRCRMRDYYGIL